MSEKTQQEQKIIDLAVGIYTTNDIGVHNRRVEELKEAVRQMLKAERIQKGLD